MTNDANYDYDSALTLHSVWPVSYKLFWKMLLLLYFVCVFLMYHIACSFRIQTVVSDAISIAQIHYKQILL